MFAASSPGVPSFGDLSWHRPVDSAQDPAHPLSACTLSPASGISRGQTLTKNTAGSINSEAAFSAGPFLGVGARVLVTIEASPKAGIYTVTTVGSVSVPWVLTRATDADSAAELPVGSACMDPSGAGGAGAQPALWFYDGTHFLLTPAIVGDLSVVGGNGLGVLNGPLRAFGSFAASGTRPGMAVYTFEAVCPASATTVLPYLGIVGATVGPMPWAGRIVGTTIRTSSNRTAGTATAKARINGAAQTLAPQLNATNLTGDSKTALYAAADTFAAAVALTAQVVTSSWAPTTAVITVDVYVVFDAVG